MKSKNLVLEFYQPDVMLDKEAIKQFVHPDITIEWNSSKGFVQMNFDDIMNLSDELNRTYTKIKSKISHVIAEKDIVSIRYSYFVRTIENPNEEMLLANFMVIWEIKDDKLYKGFQMSQF